MNSRKGNPHPPTHLLFTNDSFSTPPFLSLSQSFSPSSDLQMFPTQRPSAEPRQGWRQGSGMQEAGSARPGEGGSCAVHFADAP